MRCCGSGSSGRQHIEFVALGVRKDHPGRGALPTIDATRSHAQDPFDLGLLVIGPEVKVKPDRGLLGFRDRHKDQPGQQVRRRTDLELP